MENLNKFTSTDGFVVLLLGVAVVALFILGIVKLFD